MNRARIFLFTILLVVSGCHSGDPHPPKQGNTSQPRSFSALEILQRMVKTYQKADSYQDQGVLTLSYRYANEPRKDVSQGAVSWSRSNHLKVRAYQLTLTVAENKLRARITDESTGNVGNQLLVRPAGDGTPLADLYADPLVKDVLVGGRGGQPVQLELLLQENPLATFLSDEVVRKKISAASIEGHQCYRVVVKTDDGPYELWVDQANFLLRRFVYPTSSFVKDMLADPKISDVQLVAELRSAEVNPQLGKSEFLLRIPDGAKQVERFVLPPQPLPTDLYGKRVGIFQFQGLDGTAVSREQLAGKVAVLMWFADHQANRSTLTQLDLVASRFQDDPRVSIYAVCTEPEEVKDQRIRNLKKDWKLKLPVVRDREAYGRDVFRIPVAPTLVVLDGRGRLHLFEAGPNPQLGSQLPMLLKQLINGTDLAEGTLAQFAAEQEAYEQELAQSHQASLTSTHIKPASEPELFELKQMWVNQDCQEPLNPLVVTEADGAWHLYVLDGGQVVKLDPEGKTVGRFDLKPEEKGPVSYLRTAVDGAGKRWFAAGQMGGNRVYVFDSQWKKQFAFPGADQTHPGIEDFQLADLDGDGTVELYLGYRGLVGVQRVSLDGVRQWGYRGTEHVLSLTIGKRADKETRKLLLTTEAGLIQHLNPVGQVARQNEVSGVIAHHLFRAGFEAEAGAQFCGIVSTRDRIAVGLDRELKQVWQYQLPAGTFSSDLRFVQSANLLGGPGGQWLIAVADGTLHIVSADGEFADQFATGRKLSGFAAGRHGGHAVLFLADQTTLTAWRVSLRQSAD